VLPRASHGGGRLPRREALALAAATLGLALAGCASARPTRSSGVVTLYFQGSGPLDLRPDLLEAFEADHPGIRVVATPPPAGAQLDQALLAAFVSGSGPDVFWSAAPWVYASGPWLADLSPFVAAARFDLRVFPSHQLEATRWAGGLHGLPRTTNPAAYAARTDVFAAAGVALPEPGYTAQDLADLWKRLTVPGRRAGGALEWSPTSTFYLRGWGAHLVDPRDNRRCALATPAAIACGTWMWERFWLDGSARGLQGQDGWAAFGNGSLAMAVVTASSLPAAAALYAGFSWRLVPFPRWPAGPATSTDSEFYGIRATTAHPREAWELLVFVTSPTWQRAAIQAGLVPPSRVALWPDYVRVLSARIPALAEQPTHVLLDAVTADAAYPPETFAYQQAAVPVLQAYWQRIFGPGHTLTVARGFPACAAAVDRAEAAAAAKARV
jgi:multiple sugar transport system substrate-binding protein